MSDLKARRYSESRPIRPFRISENGLGGCAFRVRPDADFAADDPWSLVLEPEDIRGPEFRPEIRLVPDLDLIELETGIDAQSLAVFVVMRDPALWKSERLAAWRPAELPERYEVRGEVLARTSGARGLEILLQASPAEVLEPRFRIASTPGQIVAERSFRIAVPTDGAEFPVETVDAEYFEELGLPKDTVWVVDWKTTVEFDRPAEEVLVVLINRDVGEKLLRMSSGDTVGKVFWTEMATEIFLEICMTVFGSSPEAPTEQEGFLAKLTERLGKISGENLDQLVARARNVSDGTRFFRAHLQAALDLGQKISRINLAGRSS